MKPGSFSCVWLLDCRIYEKKRHWSSFDKAKASAVMSYTNQVVLSNVDVHLWHNLAFCFSPMKLSKKITSRKAKILQLILTEDINTKLFAQKKKQESRCCPYQDFLSYKHYGCVTKMLAYIDMTLKKNQKKNMTEKKWGINKSVIKIMLEICSFLCRFWHKPLYTHIIEYTEGTI